MTRDFDVEVMFGVVTKLSLSRRELSCRDRPVFEKCYSGFGLSLASRTNPKLTFNGEFRGSRNVWEACCGTA